MVSEDPREPDEPLPSNSTANEPAPNEPAPTDPALNEPALNEPALNGPTSAEPGPGGDAALGNTVERPPADPWAEETAVRPPLSDLPPTAVPPAGVGPSGTGVLPTVPDERPGQAPEPRWSARAQVRTPDVEEQHEEEWADPGRSPLTPILIAVGVLVLIGLIVIGAVLLLNNRDTPGVTPSASASATTPASTAAPSSAARTSAAPTTSAPTEVAIPDVKGLDYDAAAAKLTAAGFVPDRRDEVSNLQPAGKVVGTDPAVGLVVRTGTKITIIVSKGVPTATATTTARPSTPVPTSTH